MSRVSTAILVTMLPALLVTLLIGGVNVGVVVGNLQLTDRAELRSGHWWFTGLSVLLTICLIGIWGWTVRVIRRNLLELPAGGVPITVKGPITRAMMARYTPVHFAWGMTFWAGIAAVLLIGFRTPPTPLAGLPPMYALAAIVFVASFFVQRWRLARGHVDLIIDAEQRQLTLPSNFGRHEAVVVPFDRITSVRTRSTLAHGDAMTFIVELVWNEQGLETVSTLAHWINEDRANDLASWLTRQVG